MPLYIIAVLVMGVFGVSTKLAGDGIEDAGQGINFAASGLTKLALVGGLIYLLHLQGGLKWKP